MNCLNLCGLNSCVTYITRNPQWCHKLSHKQRQFFEDLGLDLVNQRWNEKQCILLALLSQYNKLRLFVVVSIDSNQDEQGPINSKRKRRNRCTIDRKSSRICTKKKLFVPTIYNDWRNQIHTSIVAAGIPFFFFRKPALSTRNAKNLCALFEEKWTVSFKLSCQLRKICCFPVIFFC